MTIHDHPDITCTKCSAVVSWRPHCPHCHAYLEFSGNPPWHPEAPKSPTSGEPEDELAAEDPAPSNMSSAGKEPEATIGESQVSELSIVLPVMTIPAPLLVEAVSEDATEAVSHLASEPGDPAEPGAFSMIARAMRRDPDRSVVGYLAALTVALILIILLAALSGPESARFAAPFLIGWALVSVAIFGVIPEQREFEKQARDDARLAAIEQAESERLAREAALLALLADLERAREIPQSVGEVQADEQPIEAREPQTIVQSMEKTAPILVTTEEVRDLACDSCGRLNLHSHRFCEQCGSILGGAVVAPNVVAVSAEEAALAAEEARKKKIQVSSSWRTPIFAFAIVGVVIGALAFAFLGPGAFQLRFGMTRAFQVINQWIDPYSGKAVTIETVTASSSLPGTDPQEVATSDARTFWASASLPNYGTGSILAYTLAQPTEIDRMVIFPGIQSTQFDSRALASPKDITLKFDDGSTANATLAPLDLQSDSRQLVSFPQNVTQKITLTINSVYPPRGKSENGFGEVAVSGTQFLEVPQPPKVFGFQNGVRTPGIPGVGSGGANQ
jgi:hypothetical protein